MNTKTENDFYARVSLNLLTITLLATGLYFGRTILLPFFFAILFAMLLHPMVCFLVKIKMNRVLAIFISLFTGLLFIATIIYFLSTQIGSFLQDIPEIKQKIGELSLQTKRWVSDNFNIDVREQNQYLEQTSQKMSDQSPSLVQRTVLTLTEVISYFIFLPVYTFLILYHKDLIIRFLSSMFKKSEEDKIMDVLYESQYISQQYIIGLIIQSTTVFILNTAGFLILGIKYPVFLALIAALLNIIPYIGMLMANVFCFIVTLVSNESSLDAVYACAVLAGVQLIDNNVLMPFIVGSKIKINALAIILGVVVGGALCGVPGMFLAIPGLALMKVVFERVESLKPWSILLGDETSEKDAQHNFIKRAVYRVKDKTKKKSGS